MVDRLVGTTENAKRIANVESCFGIHGVPLTAAERVLVGEGVLKKRCRKKLKPRQMYLFNDILVYGSIIYKNKKFTRQHIIPLENVKIEDLPEDSDSQFGWLIKTPTKSFAVYAASQNEKREWINHITMCIKDLLDKTGNRPISQHAPCWVPDHQADCCMYCEKSQFTMINRRHHCRNCGKIVCGGCSRNSVLLVNISTKPSRVCDGCWLQFQQSEDKIMEEAKRKSTQSNSDSDSDSEGRNNKGSEVNKSLDELDTLDQPTFYRTVNQESLINLDPSS